jgi:hypothetical protein
MAAAMSEASSAIRHAATIEPHRHREPSARQSAPHTAGCGKQFRSTPPEREGWIASSKNSTGK